MNTLRAAFSDYIRTFVVLGLLPTSAAPGQIERIWLTHRTTDPSKTVVNWTTEEPGSSVVRYGTTEQYDREVRIEGSTTLHHVEIPIPRRNTTYHYSVSTAEVDGFTCYNTSLSGKGDRYPDPDSKFLQSEDSYILLTFTKKPPQMTVEIKGLDGTVLDRKQFDGD